MSNQPICDTDTPDPWVVAANSRFYLTFTLGNRIEIWQSPHLEDFHNCQKSIIWKPPPGSSWSEDIWAPELHYLNGTWYIYTCAAPPGVGNPGHRTVLLKSSKPDPMDPDAWTFLGPLKGVPDHWSIDATVFTTNGHELYCCWSGWPLDNHSDTQQDLFLIQMASPEEALADSLVCISKAEQPWERPDNGQRGVNEGPTWVNFKGFKGIVYSAHGSWTSEYKLGLLALVGEDPLRPESWVKRQEPLMVSDSRRGGPFGPGHASFLPNPHNNGQIFCIYHGTENVNEGWNNRKARVIGLGPESFAQHASPVCCAYEAKSPGVGLSSARQKVEDTMEKIVECAPGKVKEQFQGILGKAKKVL
ncbi:Extracellular exo-alpha-(1-_5)-L-arabinofuranosidase [Cytospora mali]|uniref:Extracellular exo-alpha-(1->5)-L-arabinofuranosidase n=1 Tax=Cytospora mali TaxID=578113 RepID=A0A194UMP7_CYTMA|nr:Extracellular exo-alpha-(1->5)-L-arabinofuranosidase [Valsa mali var. pyri (nom. inval.)]